MDGACDETGAYDAATCEGAHALVVRHYEGLKALARAQRRRREASQALRTTELVHECFLKLRAEPGWHDDEHFLRTASLAIRQVLLDEARRALSAKRGGGSVHVPLTDQHEVLACFHEGPEQIVAIGDLLTRLGELGPRLVQVVDCRYFAGYTEAETAELLGVTERTVRRDWTRARAWLADAIRGNAP